jgi:hypothetical protein
MKSLGRITKSIVRWKSVFIVGWVLSGAALLIALWVNIKHHVEGAVVWQHGGLMTLAFSLGAVGIAMVLGSLPDDRGTSKK